MGLLGAPISVTFTHMRPTSFCGEGSRSHHPALRCTCTNARSLYLGNTCTNVTVVLSVGAS